MKTNVYTVDDRQQIGAFTDSGKEKPNIGLTPIDELVGEAATKKSRLKRLLSLNTTPTTTETGRPKSLWQCFVDGYQSQDYTLGSFINDLISDLSGKRLITVPEQFTPEQVSQAVQQGEINRITTSQTEIQVQSIDEKGEALRLFDRMSELDANECALFLGYDTRTDACVELTVHTQAELDQLHENPSFIEYLRRPDHTFSMVAIDRARYQDTVLSIDGVKAQERLTELGRLLCQRVGDRIVQTATQPTDPANRLEVAQPIDSHIRWDYLASMGITRVYLEEHKQLDRFIKGMKTDLLEIITDRGVEPVKLRWTKEQNGHYDLFVHTKKERLELEHPFYGYTFTESDKANLAQYGTLFRTIPVEINGAVKEYLLGVDKELNELVLTNPERMRLPNRLETISIDAEQKRRLLKGEYVEITRATLPDGSNGSGYLYLNPGTHNLTFTNREPKQTIALKQTSDQQERHPPKLRM